DGVLLTPGYQPTTVRAEGHVHTRPGNPRAQGEASFLLLVEARRVPELHDPVSARRSQVLAALAKDHSEHFPLVGIERADFRAGPGGPRPPAAGSHPRCGWSRRRWPTRGAGRPG